MPRYRVDVSRSFTGYECRSVIIEADTQEKAEDEALYRAGNDIEFFDHAKQYTEEYGEPTIDFGTFKFDDDHPKE